MPSNHPQSFVHGHTNSLKTSNLTVHVSYRRNIHTSVRNVVQVVMSDAVPQVDDCQRAL